MRNYIDIEKIIKEMSLKEKAMFLTGSKPMHNYGVKRLNIPSLTLLDGPNGLRKKQSQKNAFILMSMFY